MSAKMLIWWCYSGTRPYPYLSLGKAGGTLMMKPVLVFVFLLSLCSCQSNHPNSSVNSKYLGQETPGNVPQVFGKNIVSIEGRFEMGFTLSPDGYSMAFGVAHESRAEETNIFLLTYRKEGWTSPDRSFLNDNVNTFFPVFGPSGNTFYYAKANPGQEPDLWVADYVGKQARNPQPVDSVVNSSSREAGHGVTRSGSFYFTSNRDKAHECCGDVYVAALRPDGYMSIQKIDALSSVDDEESLFISAQEDYMIIQAWRTEYDSKHDLYISYRDSNGEWAQPERLNDEINSKEIEQRPFVSRDHAFLFFSRMSVGTEDGQTVYDSDIYWVSTASIFRPYVYNAQFEASFNYEESVQFNFPQDVFKDVDDEHLSFQLTLGDGSRIPDWLDFDSENLAISGTWQFREVAQFKLMAMDALGNSGTLVFEL